MNERDEQRVQQSPGGQSSLIDEPEVLQQLPNVHAGRHWKVDDLSRKFKETMEVLFVFEPESLDQEVRWFEQFEYARVVMQLHVEQVMQLKLKERREVYKRWRADLGDEQARRYAKFAEYVLQNGRPRWFKNEITLFPDTIALRPSSVSTELPVSWKPSQRGRTATRQR